jgi:hypothetical protein
MPLEKDGRPRKKANITFVILRSQQGKGGSAPLSLSGSVFSFSVEKGRWPFSTEGAAACCARPAGTLEAEKNFFTGGPGKKMI